MLVLFIQPLVEDNGKYRLYPFSLYEEGRHFEVYILEIDKGGYLSAKLTWRWDTGVYLVRDFISSLEVYESFVTRWKENCWLIRQSSR